MTPVDLSKIQQQPPPSGQFDEIQNLYVGCISEAAGWLKVKDERLDARFWGEMLLYAEPDGGYGLRRLALYGALLKPPPEDPIGVFSLAGPLRETSLPGPEGSINGLRLKLHYRALTRLEPRQRSEGAVFPQVEEIAVSLAWNQKGKPDPATGRLEMEVSLKDMEWVNRKLGLLQALELKPVLLPFQLAGTGSPRDKPLSSLLSHCDSSNPNGPDYLKTVERRLPIKFVNLVWKPGDLNVLEICSNQANRACEVWRQKAALDLTVWPNKEPIPPNPIVASKIEEGSEKNKKDYGAPDEASMADIPTLGYASPNHVEVYLVDELPAGYQGYSLQCGEAGAYCLLELSSAKTNSYLLAHELGHALGLYEPDEGDWPGSHRSVMEKGVPNLSANTLYNCRIFTCDQEYPLNPIVRTTAIPDCFHPDWDDIPPA